MLINNVNLITIELPESQHKVDMLPYYPYGAEQATQAALIRDAKINLTKSAKATRRVQGEDDSVELTDDVLDNDSISAEVLTEIKNIKLIHMVRKIDGQEYTDKTQLIEDLHSLPRNDVALIFDKITEIEQKGKLSDPKEQTSLAE